MSSLPPALDHLTKLAQAIDGLPTLPVVALKLGEVLHARRSSVHDVAALLGSDPSLCAKLLRLVNSAYFGIPGGVTDVAKAIPFVGFNTIYQLVLSVSVLDTLKTPSGGTFDARPLWLHSLAVASTAQVLAEQTGHADPGGMFTAGLLHDMGKIALAKVAPHEFLAAQHLQHDEGLTSIEAETRVGLPCHDRIGADLARRWRLPQRLSVPIEAHHAVLTPSIRDRLAVQHRASTEIIAVANLLAHDVVTSAGGPETTFASDPRTGELLDALGLTTHRLDSLHKQVALQLERSRPFLALLES